MLIMIMMRHDENDDASRVFLMMMTMITIVMWHDGDDAARHASFLSYLRLPSSGIAKPTSMPRS